MSDDSDDPDKVRDPETGQFIPGHSGMGGRPKGSRNKLSEAFWTDLYAKWRERGIEAIDRMIDEKPNEFVRVVATQTPKDVNVNHNPLSELSDDDLADVIARLRQSLAAADAGSGVEAGGSGDGAPTRH